MNFSENFKRICTERGTNPTRLVQSLGLSPNKVTLWNNGGLPKQDVLHRLSEALGVSVMEFFRDDEDDSPLITIPVSDYVALSEDERDIIDAYRSLDRKSKHKFMTTIYAINENEGAEK